ncbi:hypothetical protein JHK85_024845 [Glycine max]|nr:hypothetical protein JHK85_024845 [Glycine max]
MFFQKSRVIVHFMSCVVALYIVQSMVARYNDMDDVKILEATGVSLDSKDEQGRTDDIELLMLMQFEDDVYLPTDEPHGSIQASLSRLWYYLKGPVVFTDVTWFCEDCATKLGVPPALDQSTPISFVSRNNNI